MYALALIAAFAVLALASATVLADSGLRWWSAFARLRNEIAGSRASQGQSVEVTSARLRPAYMANRSRLTGARKPAVVSVTRAAA